MFWGCPSVSLSRESLLARCGIHRLVRFVTKMNCLDFEVKRSKVKVMTGQNTAKTGECIARAPCVLGPLRINTTCEYMYRLFMRTY